MSTHTLPAATIAALPAPLLDGGRGWKGHVDEMERDPLGLLSRARARGPVVRLRFAYLDAYAVSDPAAIQQVLVRDAAKFGKTTRSYRLLKRFIGDGLVTAQGEHWLARRRVAQPAFLRKRIATLAERMVAATAELADGWAPGQVVDVHEAMNALALRIAGETFFSADLTGEAAAIGQALAVGMDTIDALINSPLPAPEYWPTPTNLAFRRAARTLRRVTNDLIAQRRAEGGVHDDLLGLLMAAADEEGGVLTDAQLCDEALTMLVAGHETTGNGLTWLFKLLAEHPGVVARLQAEAREALGDRAPTAADYRRLPYTLQVVQEGLRLFPPVWVVERRARETTTLAGVRVPKGAWLFLSQWAVHRDPRLWPEPERFDPERFAADQPAPDRFAYFPFSRGQRQCIGDRFALMEMVLVVATVMQRFGVESVGDTPGLAPRVTLRPDGPLRVRLTGAA